MGKLNFYVEIFVRNYFTIASQNVTVSKHMIWGVYLLPLDFYTVLLLIILHLIFCTYDY